MHEAYQKLATVLDTLPNGFPPTESGVEMRILQRIFTPDEARLFCELKLNFETLEQIADRTGRAAEELDAMLTRMRDKGQLFGVELDGIKLFKMLPWVFGIYEFQLPHMDRELAEMCEEYSQTHGPQFFENKPQLMQILPVEKEIPGQHEALPYERVSHLIENGQAFLVNECICKKEQALMDHPCDRPLEVCLAIAPIPGVFDDAPNGRPITKQEAYQLLEDSEKNGLVHMTWNVENGHFFICNCCGCCCGVLRSITEHGIYQAVNSYYYAQIDPELCISCGICADERCQVNAIEERDEAYYVMQDRCIGCGLCLSTCPEQAISLIPKQEEEIVRPPQDEMAWFEERGRQRGVDFSQFK